MINGTSGFATKLIIYARCQQWPSTALIHADLLVAQPAGELSLTLDSKAALRGPCRQRPKFRVTGQHKPVYVVVR